MLMIKWKYKFWCLKNYENPYLLYRKHKVNFDFIFLFPNHLYEIRAQNITSKEIIILPFRNRREKKLCHLLSKLKKINSNMIFSDNLTIARVSFLKKSNIFLWKFADVSMPFLIILSYWYWYAFIQNKLFQTAFFSTINPLNNYNKHFSLNC